MRFRGTLIRDGKWWLAEVPVFDAMTQGRSRAQALEMIADWFVTMAGDAKLDVEVHLIGNESFEINSENVRVMISLLLQRQRQRSGLTLAQAAERLGARSRNAYARYEQGVCAPTVEKLDELLRAVAPDSRIVFIQSEAAR